MKEPSPSYKATQKSSNFRPYGHRFLLAIPTSLSFEAAYLNLQSARILKPGRDSHPSKDVQIRITWRELFHALNLIGFLFDVFNLPTLVRKTRKRWNCTQWLQTKFIGFFPLLPLLYDSQQRQVSPKTASSHRYSDEIMGKWERLVLLL